VEIGSFIELQFPRGREFYSQTRDIARLNTGRAAIWHAFRCTGCTAIWLPYYQCDTVRDFLAAKGAQIRFYHLDRHFNPIDLTPAEDEAVLLVNYYGIMSATRMAELARPYSHAIIDNCQAFFCASVQGSMNVYSCRKFVGVPDGAYVIGPDAQQYTEEYPQGYSSDTALFLLQRIEFGCEGKAYQSRALNEHRIDAEDCCRMSKLTHTILDGTDYDHIQTKRRQNFQIAQNLLSDINRLDPTQYYDDSTIPMVYPLVVEDDSLLPKLQDAKHFQGHWWSYICNELPENTFEYYLSRYVIPITIDQRYGHRELEYLNNVIRGK